MMVDVGIRISGVDFDAPEVTAVFGDKYPDVFVTGQQPAVLQLCVPDEHAVSHVVELLRAIQADIPQIHVDGVDRDLVGVTDIAHRAGVSREGARKWTQSPDFPAPFAHVPSASMPIWAWTQVASWLKNERSLDLDEQLPTVEILTQIENCLMRNPDHTSVEWHQVAPTRPRVEPPRFTQATPVNRTPGGGRAQRTDVAVDSVAAAATREAQVFEVALA